MISVEKAKNEIDFLWNYGTESKWRDGLTRYYEKLTNPKVKALDGCFEYIDPKKIESLSAIQFYDFLHDEYFIWKYTAKNRLATTRRSLRKYIDEGRLDELADIQRHIFAVDHANIEECLCTVQKIHGLGFSGASGLLAVLFPQDLGTVDQFVCKALLEVKNLGGKEKILKMNPNSLRIKDAVILMRILRDKANELNRRFNTDFWTPRKIDMVLWAVGR